MSAGVVDSYQGDEFVVKIFRLSDGRYSVGAFDSDTGLNIGASLLIYGADRLADAKVFAKYIAKTTRGF